MTQPLPDDIDPRLKIELANGWGTVFLVGNPHTFRGRMAAWHVDGFDISISKHEIESMTPEAAIWIDGFLAGSEPPPPKSGDEAKERKWDKRPRYYRKNGQEP